MDVCVIRATWCGDCWSWDQRETRVVARIPAWIAPVVAVVLGIVIGRACRVTRMWEADDGRPLGRAWLVRDRSGRPVIEIAG